MTEDMFSHGLGLSQQVLAFGQLEQNSVHQVVAIQIRIENEVGGISYLGDKFPDIGNETEMQSLAGVQGVMRVGLEVLFVLF